MKKILIWGRGSYFQYKKNIIETQYNIIAYIDSSIEETKLENGIPVISPNNINTFYYDFIFIMSATYMHEIIDIVLQLQIDLNKLVLGPNIPPLTLKERQYISDRNKLFLDLDGNIYYKNDSYIIAIRNYQDIEKAIQLNTSPFNSELYKQIPLLPVSRIQGWEKGISIGRKYINQFIESNKSFISGTVMEIGDRRYSSQYMKQIKQSYIFDIIDDGTDPYHIKGNLETGEGVIENFVDCFIITQTLCSIFRIDKAIKNIVKMVKNGGYILLTDGLITPIIRGDYETYGLYWKFTDQSIRLLFEKYVGKENIQVSLYGNVKTAAAFLYGIPSSEIPESEMAYQDRDYPLIIGAIIKNKKTNSKKDINDEAK